ncbi:hypothetical protein NGM10_03800 [Halorussus salilacus]|uniref:DUF7322 domain-containing protein n=1 Tax=Halorussus salilacus TaxID=2953750 RepID=UPI0020A09EA5|nr:hypothetical protein [Halorussus salilacus]USZ68866.1 hypothetical protein NGM10_03800 [Halorussus salilacus]
MPTDDPFEDPFDDADQAEIDLRPDDPAEGLRPDPPRVGGLSEQDADPDLKRQFWTLVLLFNVALFAASLGLMLVGFEGRWRVGGALFAVGVVAFARGWFRYRSVRED